MANPTFDEFQRMSQQAGHERGQDWLERQNRQQTPETPYYGQGAVGPYDNSPAAAYRYPDYVAGGKPDSGFLGDVMNYASGNIDYRAVAGMLPHQQQGARMQQEALGQQAQHWGMTGQGPSAAQMMLDRQRGANVAQAQSMAKSAQGSNPYLAQRQAANQAAQTNMAADEQQAMTRAREQQAMLGMAGQLRGDMRSGDVDAYRAEQEALGRSQGINADIEMSNAQGKRDVVKGIGSMIAMASDKRVKKDISPMTTAELDELLSTVRG